MAMPVPLPDDGNAMAQQDVRYYLNMAMPVPLPDDGNRRQKRLDPWRSHACLLA
jgi:hypothetical protein